MTTPRTLHRAKTSPLPSQQGMDNAENRNEVELYELRKKRYPKTHHSKKVPGFDIDKETPEQLELLASLNLTNNPLAQALKIKAAHELGTRYIEGAESKRDHKAPHDQLKAYGYAEKEINSYTIKELEEKFFQIEENGQNINIVKSWLNKYRVAPFYNAEKLNDLTEIDKFIDQAKWNGLLRAEKDRNRNAILVAWEKQLIAARLAKYYRNLKKEKRDTDSALAAKFYKRLVHHFNEHEPPESRISLFLKKFSPHFNRARLTLSRIVKPITLVYMALPEPIRWAFNVASLYFILPFILDIIVLIKEGPVAFWEDNRPSRMANDGLWFALNLTGILLGIFLTPIAPIAGPLLIASISLGGFVFDVGAETAVGVYGYKSQQTMLDKVNEQLAKLADVDINHTFTNRENFEPTTETAEYKQQIEQKKALLEIHQQLLNKRKELYINRAYTLTIMATLATCAVFILFPFAALSAAPLIAACTALVVGSVFGGLGKHIFWNVIMDKEFHADCKEKFFQAGRWIKKHVLAKILPTDWLTPKVKAPFIPTLKTKSDAISQDDWNVIHPNTKNIQQSLSGEDLVASNSSAESTALLKDIQTRHYKNNQVGYTLHRSPSGLLFVHERKTSTPDIEQTITPNSPQPV